MANQCTSVYSQLQTGTRHVRWDRDGTPVTVVVYHYGNGGALHKLTIPGTGYIIMHACKRTTYADFMRILLDDECPAMAAARREPGGRWQGITKVLS